MTVIQALLPNGGELTEQQARICRINIALLKAFKANPPLPQKDYVAKPLAQTIIIKRVRRDPERERERSMLRAAEHQKQLTPAVRVTATAPYPVKS